MFATRTGAALLDVKAGEQFNEPLLATVEWPPQFFHPTMPAECFRTEAFDHYEAFWWEREIAPRCVGDVSTFHSALARITCQSGLYRFHWRT